jgi:uncharacterized OB-fold protein
MSEEVSPNDTVRDLDHVDYDVWRDRLEAGVLVGLECASCGHVTATPKGACTNCGARELAGVELPTRGKVYSETTINVPPEGLEGPYQVVMVDLGTTRLLVRAGDGVEIGDEVAFAGTTVADGFPAPVFEPVD